MKRHIKLSAAAPLFLLLLVASCQKVQDELVPETQGQNSSLSQRHDEPGFAENDMVMLWNQKTSIVLGAPMIQPARSRLFAIVQIAVHDVLNNIKPKYERYIFEGREQFANPDAAVASAAHQALTALGRGSAQVNFWLDSCLATVPEGESKSLGIALGIEAANAIIANRANDGITQIVQMSPTPLDGDEPGEYRSPLTIVSGAFVYLQPPMKYVPNWGTAIRPYVVQSNHQFRPAGPDPVTSASYTTEFNEVKLKGARVGSTRTEAESVQARFWSENRPSITWNDLARAVIKTKKMDAWKTARLFALLHTSMGDGLNSTLNAMYHFYYWRPETGIRLAATDGNAQTSADTEWLPFLTEVPNRFPTPPQPGYASSFAAYGGAAAEILRSVFGTDNTSVSLSSATLPGTTMHITSFSQAARDNSISKIFAGWEFRKSVLDGEELGRQIAAYVYQNEFRQEE